MILRNIGSKLPDYTVSHPEAHSMNIYCRKNLKFRILRLCKAANNYINLSRDGTRCIVLLIIRRDNEYRECGSV
jgi:hypothetical protein